MFWRDLLTGRREAASGELVTNGQDSAGSSDAPGVDTLEEIEAAALAVYADRGLPVRRGHYRRGPRAQKWEYLGDSLDAARRWDMVLERPAGSGWRFAALEDLGRYAGTPDLVAASALLTTCQRLRDSLTGSASGASREDIERAIQLGVSWQKLQDARLWKAAARLRLTPPDDEAVRGPLQPRAKKSRRAKPTGTRRRTGP